MTSLEDFFATSFKRSHIEPVEYDFKPVGKRICTFDTETDPFMVGRHIKPFTCGFHIVDSGEYFDFWGDDCIAQFFEFLTANYSEEELVIYVHNGGNFDFYFCLDYFDNGMAPFIINGRLVRIMMQGQEFRDSYSAVPVALDKYKKMKIRYRIFEKDARNRPYFKRKIREYQRLDCVYLGELISAWLDKFGNRLTMASAALASLRSFHGFESTTEQVDDKMRPWYFGGRVECFESGIIEDDFIVYDVNGMYPDAMANCLHPVSATPIPQSIYNEDTVFARILASSSGALPMRAKDGGLCFPHGTHEFFACKHEIDAGIETGLLEILEVREAYKYEVMANFETFILDGQANRLAARIAGDKVNDLFYKLRSNSSYGKLAQDPRKYEDYLFNPEEIPTPFYCEGCNENGYEHGAAECCGTCQSKRSSPIGWYIHTIRQGRFIYARAQSRRGSGFFNVATASSITSASRAKLLKGIAKAERPIYCDTDSIICRRLDVLTDNDTLGAWKIEASGDTVCIAGKKLYAVFDKDKEIKKASKGVRLTAEQIRRVANGEIIIYTDPVPKFHLDGTDTINRTRTIRITA